MWTQHPHDHETRSGAPHPPLSGLRASGHLSSAKIGAKSVTGGAMSRTTFSSDTVIKALRARVCVSAASLGAILGPSWGHLGAILTVSGVTFPFRAL